ncbi:46105_t:CDS:2 [Gigaspora margarita]|uniref:46105_t:CDS:1 n=1 Tax=Gigaspora margarita TaxID=4874 RepID=A0ABN7UNU3_GIGMA|nr:46105_t:CDS:2 [Gigaspora margarita]
MFIPSRAIKNASSKLLYKTGWVPYGIPFGVRYRTEQSKQLILNLKLAHELALEGKNVDAVEVLVLAFKRNDVKYFSSIEIDDIYQLTIKYGIEAFKTFENLMERTFWCWNLSRERKNKCLTEAQELEKAKDKKLRDKEESSRAMDCMELELERRRLEEIEREKEEEVKQREEVLKRDIGKSSKVKKEISVSQEVQDCNVINKNEDSSDDDFTVPPPTISSTTTFKPSPNIPVALPAPPSNAPPMPVSNISPFPPCKLW